MGRPKKIKAEAAYEPAVIEDTANPPEIAIQPINHQFDREDLNILKDKINEIIKSR